MTEFIFFNFETGTFTTGVPISFMTEVPIIQKPVQQFADQINGLVSIW